MSAKVALITGASSGIGARLAVELAAGGFSLLLTARRQDRLDAVAEECRAKGVDVATFAISLDDPAAPEAIVRAALERFGGIDLLVNNAGIGMPSLFADSPPDVLRRQLVVNFDAPVLLTRHALPSLIDRKGMIINVGSSISAVEFPIYGAYGATKAAIAYWNNALRRELKPKGVRVCLVEPGPVLTEFFDSVARDAPESASKLVLESPPAIISATPEEAARRIARLVDRPRRRLSMLRRYVIPARAFGVLFRMFPALGDLLIGRVVAQYGSQPSQKAAPR